MRYVRLLAISDSYDNEPGLVIKGTDLSNDGIFADRGGLTLPHDLLEHQNGAHLIGQVWDEMQAEGAYWYLRGQHLGNYRGAAADLCTMARDSLSLGYNWRAPRTRAHNYDDCFHEIIGLAREMIPSEFDDDDFETFPVNTFFNAALHNMRVGFNKAARRGHDQRQFDAIRRVLEKNTIDFEGQEFILGFGDGHATIRST